MPSAWVERRTTSAGVRYRLRYRIGGRESVPRLGGTFGTMREARARRDWILGELANMRVPDLAILAEPTAAPTLADVAQRWMDSRVDAAENTKLQHRTAIRRVIPHLGTRPVDTLAASDVAELVGKLGAAGAARESIRKTLNALAMVLDFAGVAPNPARDKIHVRLPRADHAEITPPTADHIEATLRLLPTRYRLPLLVLDATGMRLGELEHLTWGDVDEPRGRWRVSAAVAKTRQARWVNVPPTIFEPVMALVPRDDRAPERQVFLGFGGDRFRTAIARACVAAGVPTFTPHDLRHRRISLMHLAGAPWARIGEHVGQRNLAVTANTYTHVLLDESELDLTRLLAGQTTRADPRDG